MARRQQQQRSERPQFLGLDDPSFAASRSQRNTRYEHEERTTQRMRASRDARRTPEPPAQRDHWYRPTLGKIILLAFAIAFAVFAFQLCSSATPIRVTVNGTNFDLRGDKTLQVALKESGLPINPGDLISLKGTVLERGAGDPFAATVNNEETADPNYRLRDGDVVSITDGKDTVEPYDATESPVPHGASIVGLGAIHTFAPGVDGVIETRTGRVSGEVVEKQTVDPVDLIETRIDPDVGDSNIVALTFDDGPSLAYTQDFLDILAQNNAKATFFCRGDAIQGDGAELVRSAAAAGHQICTHSYDNGLPSGGKMELLMADELAAEVTNGLQAISDALGTEPSRLARIGSEDMYENEIPVVAPLIDAEIGWTLDTGDWIYMTEDDIYKVLMTIKPGDIVRMHDGGDHQDVTANALKRALPELVKKGYQFVTLDEFLSKSTNVQITPISSAEPSPTPESASEPAPAPAQ